MLQVFDSYDCSCDKLVQKGGKLEEKRRRSQVWQSICQHGGRHPSGWSNRHAESQQNEENKLRKSDCQTIMGLTSVTCLKLGDGFTVNQVTCVTLGLCRKSCK